MSIHVILDWDDTCMDTAAFKRVGFAMFAELFPGYDIPASYAAVRSHGYSFDRHFRYLSDLTGAGDGQAYAEASARLFKNISELLYPDAAEFIKKHAAMGDLVFITAGDEAFQRQKIAGCGYGDVPMVACGDGEKPAVLRRWLELRGVNPDEADFLFVDNNRENVESVQAAFPKGRCVLIDRGADPAPDAILTFSGLEDLD